MGKTVVFDFSKNADISSWRVVNDGVMGGLYQGTFSINEEGNGSFSGKVSLENNGGFSSISHRFGKKNVKDYSKVIMKIRWV